MAIIVVGINHKTVPLSELERLAIGPSELPKALARLVAHDPIHEGAILSTCNRTEVYATVHRFHPAVQAVRHFLADVSGVDEGEIANGLYTYYDAGAARHLFAVASGIDSMVTGEPQILGQVRAAFHAAQEEGTARRMLSTLFQRALRVGKRARSETGISRHVTSLPQAAARKAAELLGDRPPREVVVVGAGRMGELAVRALLDLGDPSVVVCNRSIDRAEELAERVGGRAAGLDELPTLLGSADVLVSATAAPEVVVTFDVVSAGVSGRRTRLAAVDLGVPRDIDPAAEELEGVELRDIEDLQAIVEAGSGQRLEEIPKVEAIVDEEVDAFCAWERSLALGPSIAELHTWAEEVRHGEVEKAARRLGVDDEGREVLEALARGVARKILHRPVSGVKDLVSGPDGQVYLEVFQELFDLDASES